MKHSLVKLTPLLLLPALLWLAGCRSDSYTIIPASDDPAFAGGIVMVESHDTEATVQAIDAATRQIVLKHTDDTTTTNIAGPEVVNFDKIKAGDLVQAKVGEEYAFFLVKNGQPPSTTAGILLKGSPKGANPAGVMVTTIDMSARVIQVDRSKHTLTLKYANGREKQFQIPPRFTLERVAVGDDLLMRATQKIALKLVPKRH